MAATKKRPPASSIFGPPTVKQKNFATWAAQHNISTGLQADLISAAKENGLNVYYLASVILSESGGKHATNGQITTSSAGAVGIAQLLPKSFLGQSLPWDPHHKITMQDLQNPSTNLRLGAWYLKQQVNHYGYQYAYAGVPGSAGGGYNHGDTATQSEIFARIPKNVPLSAGQGPTDKAAAAAETKRATGAIDAGTSVWATFNGKKVKFVTTYNTMDPATGQIIPNAPQNALKLWGQPMTKTTFLQRAESIRDDIIAYTGSLTKGDAGMAQIARIMRQGWSQYQWRQYLVDRPGFVGSPVWQQNAPNYQAAWHQIYGPNSDPDTDAIRYAIQHNLDQSGFHEYITQRQDYTDSNEYKQNFASNQNVFRQIYGEPTEFETPTITQATKNGWDQNQFAQYLRSQPQYKSSAEWKGLMYGLADRLGLIPGTQQTVLNG